ncbi:MAG: DUF6326 family protein [Balneolaceae bacterium]
MHDSKHGTDRKMVLSTIWIFYFFNIIYADILSLMSGFASPAEPTELVETLISPEMLLVAAIFLQTGMVMIVLSRVLKHGINRWANIIIATLQTLGLLASLFVGTPTMYYIFFVIFEVSALLFIIWYAWTWARPVANE